MSEGYKADFFFPNGVIVINTDGNIEVVVADGKTMTPEELATAAIISELLKRLKGGKFISYDFNVKSFEDENATVKCEWLRSGALKLHGPCDKLYRYVTTTSAAIAEHRTFTCPKSVASLLPKIRSRAS